MTPIRLMNHCPKPAVLRRRRPAFLSQSSQRFHSFSKICNSPSRSLSTAQRLSPNSIPLHIRSSSFHRQILSKARQFSSSFRNPATANYNNNHSNFSLRMKGLGNSLKQTKLAIQVLSTERSSRRKFQSKIDRLSIFRSGIAFINYSVKIPRGNTSYEILAPQEALKGTLSIESSSQNLQIKNIRSSTTTVQEEKFCLTVTDLVEANLGAVVELQVGSAWTMGRIYSFQGGSGKGVVFLETERGTLAVPFSDIKAVRLPKYAPPDLQIDAQQHMNTRISASTKKSMLKIGYKYASASQEESEDLPIFVRYGLNDISWKPSYMLSLSSEREGTGVLSLRTNIVNQMPDFTASVLECLFGPYPLTPINGYEYDDLVQRKPDTVVENQTLAAPLYSDNLLEPSQYLFENVTLKGKHTTCFDVFKAEIPVQINNENTALTLENTSRFPWAEGPITVMKNNAIMSFGTLLATPRSSQRNLDIVYHSDGI